MTDEVDEVLQLRKLGVGIICGGVALFALALLARPLVVAGVLVGAGVLLWVTEWHLDHTVGIGLGVGVVGILVAIEAQSDFSADPAALAGFAVVSGVVDVLIAPWYVKIRDAGERVSGRS